MNNNEQCLSYNEFKNKYNYIQTDFVTYYGITNTVKKYLNHLRTRCAQKIILVNEVWACIRSGNKSVKSILQDDKLPTAVIKWNSEFINLKWKNIFIKSFKTSSDAQLQRFQARLLHRILPTGKYLALCKLINSSSCVFCENEVETLNHLFWNCNYVHNFWNKLLRMLHERCDHCARLNFNQQLIIFGVAENVFTDQAIDFILLNAKFYIYKCKLQKIKPEIDIFIQQLKFRYSIEKSLASTPGKLITFEQNWTLYRNLFI